MSAEIVIRRASQEDDDGIVTLMSQLTMPGRIAIGYDYEPSFFSALTIEGNQPKVIVAERRGEICGVGSILSRDVYLNGEPKTVGYLSSLRVSPEIRGSSALARGFQLFKEMDATELCLPFYLTSILQDNHKARNTLTSGKATLPQYKFLAEYKTIVIPIIRRTGTPTEVKIITGRQAGCDTIIKCLKRFGKKKNFFPRISPHDLSHCSGMMKGLQPSDFLIAMDGEEPVGTVALWNQSAFKNLVIKNYSSGLRLLNRAVELIRRRSFLPKLNQPFSPIYLSCVAIKDNDPALFKQLLREAINRVHASTHKFLIIGLFADDPLVATATSYLNISFSSSIYMVTWSKQSDDSQYRTAAKYLDIGSL